MDCLCKTCKRLSKHLDGSYPASWNREPRSLLFASDAPPSKKQLSVGTVCDSRQTEGKTAFHSWSTTAKLSIRKSIRTFRCLSHADCTTRSADRVSNSKMSSSRTKRPWSTRCQASTASSSAQFSGKSGPLHVQSHETHLQAPDQQGPIVGKRVPGHVHCFKRERQQTSVCLKFTHQSVPRNSTRHAVLRSNFVQ